MKVFRQAQHAHSGFTIVEIMLAVLIFGILGMGLTQGMKVARTSHDSISQSTTENRNLREGVDLLRTELKSAQETSIQLQMQADGNQQLTFQVPVDSAGAPAWGVFDRKLGKTAAEWNRAGWSLRYRVQPNAQGNPSLVRQIIDAGGYLQRETELISHVLVNGQPNGPGFTVLFTGDVWVVQIATRTEEGNGPSIKTFHIRTRN